MTVNEKLSVDLYVAKIFNFKQVNINRFSVRKLIPEFRGNVVVYSFEPR